MHLEVRKYDGADYGPCVLVPDGVTSLHLSAYLRRSARSPVSVKVYYRNLPDNGPIGQWRELEMYACTGPDDDNTYIASYTTEATGLIPGSMCQFQIDDEDLLRFDVGWRTDAEEEGEEEEAQEEGQGEARGSAEA